VVSPFQLRQDCWINRSSRIVIQGSTRAPLSFSTAQSLLVHASYVAGAPLNGRGGDKVFTSPAQIQCRMFPNMAPDRKY